MVGLQVGGNGEVPGRQVRADAVKQIEETIATVQREAPPDPSNEDWSALTTKALLDSYSAE